MSTDQAFSEGQGHEKSPGNPRSEQDCNSEMWHVSFRAFTSSEKSDPVEELRRLCELCYLWLRPDIHTKEQILDTLVMEQFMISMPQELQALVKESGVRSCKDLQDLLRSNQTPKKWVSRPFLMGTELVWGLHSALGRESSWGGCSGSVVFMWEMVCPAGDAWQCLETFLAVTMGRRGEVLDIWEVSRV